MGKLLAESEDPARKAKILYKGIVSFQNSMSALELCRKPVLAAVHSACVGAGVDLIVAADMRYCTKDAWFQVKEVSIGKYNQGYDRYNKVFLLTHAILNFARISLYSHNFFLC